MPQKPVIEADLKAVSQNRDHDVAGLYVSATVAYVRRACGEDGVTRMPEVAGEDHERLPDETGWIDLVRMTRLADAATQVLGTPDVGRQVGEEMFAIGSAQGFDQMIRASGGPVEAIEMLTSYGSRMAGGWTLGVTGSGERHVEVSSTSAVSADTSFYCGLGVGYYAKVPEVFGFEPTATHPECIVRGDKRCHTVVRWVDPGGATRHGPAMNLIEGQERLQGAAARLSAAESAEEVVDLAIKTAPRTNAGRRFLMQAEVAPGTRVVAHEGFDDSDQVDLALARIELGDLRTENDQPQICVAGLRTGRADYGWVASFHPPRSPIDWLVERPLASFAHQVATALEAARALESARRDRDRAHTLAQAARELGGATAQEEVTRVVETSLSSTPPWVDARVWLLERDDQVLRAADPRPDRSEPQLIAIEEDWELEATRTVSSPTLIAKLHPVSDHDLARSTMIPLLARDETLGCVAAGSARDTDLSDDEIELAEAIVDQAALAFDVVGLLADLKEQALHDPLTGLANRALLAEHAEQAMAQARRSEQQIGLLFIDLDRFKAVNDSLGHNAGDEVICEVADRLRTVVRGTDTVARLGGDEFVILVTECEGEPDALAVGERVLEQFDQPVMLAGEPIDISATVGVFATRPDERSWHALLDRADEAMYRGKQQGLRLVSLG